MVFEWDSSHTLDKKRVKELIKIAIERKANLSLEIE